MRYLFTICLVLVQLAKCLTAEAAVALPVNDGAHYKKETLLQAAISHDQSAELARTIQFTCIVFNLRVERDAEGYLPIEHQSNYIADDLRKRTISFPTSPRAPLIRLLLFPNHYFW